MGRGSGRGGGGVAWRGIRWGCGRAAIAPPPTLNPTHPRTHPPFHTHPKQDVDKYCEDVLCAPDTVALLNERFVCWGGDISSSDAFRLACSLRVAAYPYAALLAFSGPRCDCSCLLGVGGGLAGLG